jgi:hypothetical protein
VESRVPTFLIEVIVLLHDEVTNGGSREARGGGERRQRRWAQGEEPQIGAATGTGCGAIYTGVGAVVGRGGNGVEEGEGRWASVAESDDWERR